MICKNYLLAGKNNRQRTCVRTFLLHYVIMSLNFPTAGILQHPASQCFLAGCTQIRQTLVSHSHQGWSAALTTHLQQRLNWTFEPLAGLTRGHCGPDIWLGSGHTHTLDIRCDDRLSVFVFACEATGQLIHALCLFFN